MGNDTRNYAVILVKSISHAIKGEKILKRNELPCKLIPVPRQFSSDCGVCLRIDSGSKERARKYLEEDSLQIEEILDLEKKQEDR